MQPDMDVSPIVVDIETSGLPNAADFLEPIMDAAPDESQIEPDKRLTDPVKVAADLERKHAARVQQNLDAQAKVEQQRSDRIEQAALDWNVGRIVALAYWSEPTDTEVFTCINDEREAFCLDLFWRVARQRTIVGYNVKGFDLKFMVQRSRLLGITYPQLDFSKYSRKGIEDLYLLLTFGDGTYDKGVMRRTLKQFCRRFDIPVTDEIDGKDIPALVAAGEWDKVAAHVRADVELEVALARRLGVIAQPAAVAVGF
jgi:hypothetical protein